LDLNSGAKEMFERSKEMKDFLDRLDTNHEEFHELKSGESMIQDNISASSTPYGRYLSLVTATDLVNPKYQFIQTSRDTEHVFSDYSGTPYCSGRLFSEGPRDFFDLKQNTADGLLSIQSFNLPINPRNKIADIQVFNKIAYVALDSTTASDPDFEIIDLRSQDVPVVLSSLNTGPGLRSLVLKGQNIFAAAPSTLGQIQVIDVTDKTRPQFIGRYKIPLPSTTTPPTLGNVVAIYGTDLYIGTDKWDGPEFNVFDIVEPHNPQYLYGSEIDSKVNDIFPIGDRAYVASAGEYPLIVIDTNRLNLDSRILGKLSLSGWQRQSASRLDLVENALMLGRYSGGYNIPTDHELYKLSDDRNSISISKSTDISGGVYGIVGDHDGVFATVQGSDQGFRYFDHDLASSTLFKIGRDVSSLTCDNSDLYVADAMSPVIYKFHYKRP
jgi:hypothetical protein